MPLARWQTYRARTRQKRNALHMLALSGVVRPSHIELRYTIPIMNVGASNTAFGTKPTVATRRPPAPLEESAPVVRSRGKLLLQWLRQGLTASL